MRHPDLPGHPPVPVSPSAFADVWRHRGWQEADPPAAEPAQDRPAGGQPAPTPPRATGTRRPRTDPTEE